MESSEENISLCDGSVKKTILTNGDGEYPQVGHQVEVHYVGKLMDGNVFDSSRARESPFSFILGAGNVIKGWDEGVKTMKIGEKSRFIISPEFGYGSSGAGDVIPPDATLDFEVELLGSTEVPKRKEDMNNEERLVASEEIKDKGNKYYMKGEYDDAIREYETVVEYLTYNEDWSDDLVSRAKKTLTSAYLNLASCFTKTEEFIRGVEVATSALEIDSNSCKAYFRRGVCQLNYGMFTEAKSDLLTAAKMDPSNKEIRNELQKCKDKMTAQKSLEKSLYGGMFNKADVTAVS